MMLRPCRPVSKPAVICFVGRSNSGKTDLLVRLIPVLKAKGLLIATVKHHCQPLQLDTPGKDSFRHRKAGADISVIAAPGESGIFLGFSHDPALEEILPYLQNVDLVLCEGYKRSNFMKIEIIGRDGQPDCLEDSMTIALVSESEIRCRIPCFHPSRIDEIASFIIGASSMDFTERAWDNTG